MLVKVLHFVFDIDSVEVVLRIRVVTILDVLALLEVFEPIPFEIFFLLRFCFLFAPLIRLSCSSLSTIDDGLLSLFLLPDFQDLLRFLLRGVEMVLAVLLHDIPRQSHPRVSFLDTSLLLVLLVAVFFLETVSVDTDLVWIAKFVAILQVFGTLLVVVGEVIGPFLLPISIGAAVEKVLLNVVQVKKMV